jgi:DNA ligase-1
LFRDTNSSFVVFRVDILSKFLLHLTDKEKDVMYLMLGDIYPEYDERRIGISEQLAIKAISSSTGTNKDSVIKEWKKIGDLGEVSEKLTNKKKQTTLGSQIITIEKVINNLRKLPDLEGKGTISKKLALITELLTSADPIEAKFLIRTLLSDLRIGLKEATLRDAMAKAFFTDQKTAAAKLQKAIDKTNDLGAVFLIAKKGKLKLLEKLHLEVGKPIKAMLAQKVTNFEGGFKTVGKPCAVEYKYDGFRLIIHKKGKLVKLFTRRLENVTKQFPEVIEYINKYVKAKSFILDSEAVGYDKKTLRYTQFQKISQRIRRKYNIDKLQKELPVEVNVFDILYYNGKSLLDEPFKKRTEIIKKIIKNHPYKIIHAKQIITSDTKKAEKFYKLALRDNQEGVMLKNLDAEYNPGSRVGHMLKIKPEEKDLDLVITGAEYGTGKRYGVLSSFYLSAKTDKGYTEVGKMSTGIKEKSESGFTYTQLTELLKPLITKETGKRVSIKPKIILSVTYQEIQRSPNYESGFALRFPRFTAIREDKHLSEISSLEEIKKDFETQKRNWKYG